MEITKLILKLLSVNFIIRVPTTTDEATRYIFSIFKVVFTNSFT